jgi:hypothetical protein
MGTDLDGRHPQAAPGTASSPADTSEKVVALKISASRSHP